MGRLDYQEPPEGTQTFAKPNARSVRKKLIAANWALLVAGMNDAATGALIPYIKPAYNVGLLFVAIVYLVNFCGWLVAAFTNVHISARLGMGGTLVVGSTCQLIAYALNFWKPPFPLFAASFFFSGLGVAYQDAQANTFVADLDNAHRWLGILHAIYGVGALITPLAATAIANHTPHWHYFYLVLFGCSVISVGLMSWAFRPSILGPHERGISANKQLTKALSERSVWVLSLFFFLYVGAEVTAGGWVVEFLISVRNGTPNKVGYVASGFWGGLALGRVALADITNKLGERRMVFIYIVVALAMQLIFWFVPNIIADAVVVSLLGFFIAPFFPAGISVLTKLLPKDLHVAAIGLTSTIGQAGSAAFPFLTGAIASKSGVIVLQPIMIGLLAGMFLLWGLVPRVRKMTE
ncbi:putative MFS transporter [Thelonectria olida]|uniref:MFS transporter n=1 Tax=Thelonectria olida TaxID=1576542 RepID=A0A9P9AZ87_9HYPO|nr:putative MFS transporter [Thelonectria olida]